MKIKEKPIYLTTIPVFDKIVVVVIENKI